MKKKLNILLGLLLVLSLVAPNITFAKGVVGEPYAEWITVPLNEPVTGTISYTQSGGGASSSQYIVNDDAPGIQLAFTPHKEGQYVFNISIEGTTNAGEPYSFSQKKTINVVSNTPEQPVDPEPVEPVDPTPVDPEPEQPVDPTPVDPEPEDPVDPTPVDPEPAQPVDPTPIRPRPQEPQPDPDETDDEQDDITVVVESRDEEIPFNTIYEDNENLNLGQEEIITQGENGLRKVYYEVEYANGVEVNRTRLDQEEIINEPVDMVIKRGTKVTDDTPRLSYLTVDGGKLNPEFSPNTLNYTIDLNEDVENLVFNATSNNDDYDISGLESINPTYTNTHTITVTEPNGNYTEYVFTWNNLFNHDFEFNGNKLAYNPDGNLPLRGIKEDTFDYNEKTYKVFKDTTDSMLISLVDEKDNTSWYLISEDGDILKEIKGPLSANGKIYHKVDFEKISQEYLDQYDLELINIEQLNMQGYKINKPNFRNQYLVRMGSLTDDDAWYLIDIKNQSIDRLPFAATISRQDLDEAIGKVNKYQEAPSALERLSSSTGALLGLGAIVAISIISGLVVLKLRKKDDTF